LKIRPRKKLKTEKCERKFCSKMVNVGRPKTRRTIVCINGTEIAAAAEGKTKKKALLTVPQQT